MPLKIPPSLPPSTTYLYKNNINKNNIYNNNIYNNNIYTS